MSPPRQSLRQLNFRKVNTAVWRQRSGQARKSFPVTRSSKSNEDYRSQFSFSYARVNRGLSVICFPYLVSVGQLPAPNAFVSETSGIRRSISQRRQSGPCVDVTARYAPPTANSIVLP